jgi:hypothetical protein
MRWTSRRQSRFATPPLRSLHDVMVGGACSHRAGIPSTTLPRPRDALHALSDTGAKPQVDIPLPLPPSDRCRDNRMSDEPKLDFDRLERFVDELPTPIDHVLVTYRDATSAPMWLAEPLALNHPGRTVTVATVAGASIAQYREAGQGGI